jgi:hypothetical protein
MPIFSGLSRPLTVVGYLNPGFVDFDPRVRPPRHAFGGVFDEFQFTPCNPKGDSHV